jgi:ubiquinone/menaquinone biosynthesis C-methylase UbiE
MGNARALYEITRDYRGWARSFHAGAHSRRTAERNTAFLLPHLRPGMRLLDVGCGPGSITEGLAAAVAPGPAIGLDISRLALSGTRSFVRIQADAAGLPFCDETFDAVLLHAVLQHVPAPLDVLHEVRRVLRTGGVVGVADADFESAVSWPRNADLDRAAELIARTRSHPRIGKTLRSLLHETGFVGVEASVVAAVRGDERAVSAEASFWAAYFEAQPFVAWVVANGWASAAAMSAIAVAWRAWGVDPGAFSATLWCQAVGRVPGGAA